MSLTPAEIHHFRHNGYLKCPEILPAAMVNELKETILQDIADETAPVVRDKTGRISRISQVLDRAPIFLQAATQAVLLDALESLLGPQIDLVKNRHNHATLNCQVPTGDTFHRDAVQWSRSLISVVLYLEQTTTQNGCTQVVPGSHLLPGLEVLHKVEKEQWVADSNLLSQAVPVPMPAGGALLIDGLIFHRIGLNQTPNTRMSMTLGYHSTDELNILDDPKRILVCGTRNYRGNDRM
ncbi:MAG TPA: hypothetical protein EYG11_21320 [Candidatus Latescibacteria bacterium]|nr:hypothetical protein [Candidatus Handelsmanbacteria bacterium]HIL11240.1 hypothetical protein [Candidatus Latescibacterota bacterium]